MAKCDFCTDKKDFETGTVYDAKIHNGQWAYMCERHWQEYGCGKLGVGFGQKYINGRKVEG